MLHDTHDVLPTILEQIITLAKQLDHTELRALAYELSAYACRKESAIEKCIRESLA